MIKSPLRYPGGKSKAINQIVEYLPESFSEYREPFVGGGSVFIYLRQKFPDLKIWINDLNRELFLFWKFAQSDIAQLVKEIRYIKVKYTDGKLLFVELNSVDVNKLSDLQRAVRFFVLNRITFSGTVESGGFSQEAFDKRFTDSSIERLEKLENILSKNVKITNLDYSHLLKSEGKDVFLFLDPPYFIATKSKLYGKDGNLHTYFEHQRFAELLQQCHHRWLITYDNSTQILENFQWANISEWELQYGMNNYKQSGAAKGKELFITNYEVQRNLDKIASSTA
ncbi:MAG: DNA adenine methylase [Nostoc sp.]|uniref:DNA adenine methylase n=1 Tax=Nostoc sp. TaxID=1180 RepID=UPI002FFAAAD8